MEVLEMDAEVRVMLVFVSFAFLVGIVNGLVGIGGAEGFLLALVFFYISYKVVTSMLNLEETSYKAGAWNIIKTAVIPYWFLWLLVWTVVYSLTFY